MGGETPAYAIIICSRCRSAVSGALAAQQLIAGLAGRRQVEGFRIETVACMAGCERPLTVAFQAAGKATYLFGDIDAENDAPALSSFAELYRQLPDGWSSESQRPESLHGKILARIPSMERAS